MKKLFFSAVFIIGSLPVFSQASPASVKEAINKLLAAHARDHKFNGAVIVARKGEVIYQNGFGYKDAENKKPNDINTIFQVGSLTKQVTAAVVLQLQQEKKLSVQDKLSRYISGFANGDKITIEHLLTHTSGIYNYTNDTVLMKQDVTRSYSAKEMIDIFKRYPSDFEPGTRWNYSNSAYSLLGYIIEKVEKKPYELVVRERIFRPLGMTKSGFDFTHLADTNRAKGYFVLTASEVKPAPVVDSTIAYAAGAMYSTVGDLLKWERGLSTGRVLGPSSMLAMFTPYKNNYGYGIGIDTLFGTTVNRHSGGIHGFSTFLMGFPKEELTVIVLDNHSKGVGALAKDLAAIVLGKPYKVPEEKVVIRVDEKVLRQYTGEYQLTPNFHITVTLDGSQLKAQATGQRAFELYPEKENLFFVKEVDAKVEFVREGDQVTELVLHQNGAAPRGKKIK